MQTPPVLNFDRLLAPIPPGEPVTGVDPRTDESPNSLYYMIKSARRDARAAERLILRKERPESPPDWKVVRNQCVQALTERAKDLEITAFLIEALVRLDQAPGLRDGFRLARELIDRYWDGLYPPLSEGIAERVKSLADLAAGPSGGGVLDDAIHQIVIADSKQHGEYRYIQHIDAVARASRPEGAAAMSDLEAAAAGTEADFFQTLSADLTEALREFEQLTATLDKHCGKDGPPSSALREQLATLLKAVTLLAGDKLEPEARAAPSSSAAATEAVQAGKPAAVPLRTRDEALNGLLQVAEFFRRTEPHTVISYTLEQVVRWGRMPLPDLLAELIPEEGVRDNLFKQVGIRPPTPK